MNLIRKQLLVTTLLAGFGLGAIAQTAPAPALTAAPGAEGTRHHGKMDPAQRQARFERRMAELKQTLQITSAQETAWSSFTAALRPQPRTRVDREALQRMTTPDRIDHLRALRAERLAEMDRRGEATKAFYAALSAEQQQRFDDISSRRGKRHAHGHHPG